MKRIKLSLVFAASMLLSSINAVENINSVLNSSVGEATGVGAYLVSNKFISPRITANVDTQATLDATLAVVAQELRDQNKDNKKDVKSLIFEALKPLYVAGIVKYGLPLLDEQILKRLGSTGALSNAVQVRAAHKLVYLYNLVNKVAAKVKAKI